ncbi:hypothetical protein LTR66_007584 [Elasticomyces elasticus]|nr:hypothetical protein LTR66_007584 [Elasticomyces elasticus]
MLARQSAYRLAAGVPRMSTRVAQLSPSTAICRKYEASSVATIPARLSLIVIASRRHYATPGRPKKSDTPAGARAPSTKVRAAGKKATKKPATDDSPADNEAIESKETVSGASEAVAKGAGSEADAELQAQKDAEMHLQALKDAALYPPPEKGRSAWQEFSMVELKGPHPDGVTIPSVRLTAAAAKWKALPPAELEHWNHLANEHKAANKAAYMSWVESHTPEQIRAANRARGKLNRLDTTRKRRALLIPLIKDHRRITAPRPAYNFFMRERHASGDLRHIPLAEATKLIGQEWRALGEEEKQKYLDLGTEERIQYRKDKSSTGGQSNHTKPS